MTISQAARAWGVSISRVRTLVRLGRVKAALRTSPMPHWWIADGTKKPSRPPGVGPKGGRARVKK